MPIDDDVSRRVEKVESEFKQKERNRVVEYLILISAEMTNQVGCKPHRSCLANEL